MMKKKIIFFALLASLLTACGSKPTEYQDFDIKYTDVLPGESEDGLTLHAFCWKFSQIKENLPLIARSGFKNVLTMPVQTPKGGGASWWSFYQPLSFTIAEESTLGTKQDFLDLCIEAKKYDIGIMVDVVANHMANITDDDLEADGTPKVNPLVEQYEPVLYKNRNSNADGVNGITFHHNKTATGSGAETQYYQYGSLPDLNTANPYVQGRVLSFLKECIDAGVSGFRFDTAKHIESPTDPDYPSDFWKNTLDVAKEYYHQKTNKNLYAYGEILGDPLARSISCYTPFMDVTADGYASSFKAALINGTDASKIASAAYGKNAPADKLIAWPESHDEYTSTTSHLSIKRISKMWSVIASRKDLGGLFLARPDDNYTVGKIANYDFENEIVASANRFHNRFYKAEEYISSEGSVYVNERLKSNNDNGAFVMNINGNESGMTKTVKLPHLENGNYYDMVAGKRVVVTNGVGDISFDNFNCAFLVKNHITARPRVTMSERGGSFVDDKVIKVDVTNYEEAYYYFNNETTKTPLNDTNQISIKGHLTSDNKTYLHIYAKNGSNEVKYDLSFKKVSLIPGGFNIVNLDSKYLTDYEFYIWSWEPGKWSKNYTVEEGTVLVNTTGMTGFLFAIFAKGYVITNTSKWDSNCLKQSSDIKGTTLSSGYFDASDF